MKLIEISIKSYKGIENVVINLNDDVNFLISNNNVGKTMWSSKLFRPLLSRLNNLTRKIISLFQGARLQAHKQPSYAPAGN